MKIDELLTLLAKEIHPAKPTTNNSFNIFTVLGVETKEVIICRFLGELLDPHGSHQLGYKPLYFFVCNVLGDTAFQEKDAQAACIVLEESIDKERRVDIVIHAGQKTYPIEVKVWAGDQDEQLSDYYRYYFGTAKDRKIYYLTPTGWKPSYKSRKDLKVGQEICCLSFEKNINEWIKSNVLPSCTGRVADLANQFQEVIEYMCAESKELAEVKKCLDLDEKLDFAKNKKLKPAVSLLSYADELLKEIRIQYLKAYLDCGNFEKYEIRKCEQDDTKNIDCHALLRICQQETGKPVAWICVETNLYIVARKVKTPKLWDEKCSENYVWQYITPENYKKRNKKRFPLKNVSIIFNDSISDMDAKIDIGSLLDDIVIE